MSEDEINNGTYKCEINWHPETYNVLGCLSLVLKANVNNDKRPIATFRDANQ